VRLVRTRVRESGNTPPAVPAEELHKLCEDERTPVEALRPESPASSVDTDRREIVDAYIEEVLAKTGRRITGTEIWKRAGDKTRTEFERWESCWYERRGKKGNKAADDRFRRLLLKDKPHLNDKPDRK
jgi:hypothetical protein